MLLRALFLVAAGIATAKTPVTHEAYWKLKRIGPGSVSPDGKWVVSSVTNPAYDPKDQTSDLWIVPADGSTAPRQLTFTKSSEGGAMWSADSQRIAFTARREGDEATQVYVLNLAGGEAQRITTLASGAGDPKFSPDGKWISFVSMYDPVADRKSRKYKAYTFEGFPVRYWDHWLDERRPHLYVQDSTGQGEARDLFKGTALADEPGFYGSNGISSATINSVWTPDSSALVFVATVDRNKAAYADVAHHLYQVAVTGGEPKKLTSGQAVFGSPQFDPAGKGLYATMEPITDRAYNLDRLVRFGWPAMGNPTVIAPSFDRSPSGYAFSPDGRTIYITADEFGLGKVFTVPAAGGEAKLLMEMTEGSYSGLEIAGGASAPVVIANWQSSVSPSKVVRLNPATGVARPLIDLNEKALAELDWGTTKHFWFTAKNGRRIHNLMVLPGGFDASKKYPLVVFIHGGPHSMSGDSFSTRWNTSFLASPGYVLLMPNYSGSTGFGEKFAQAIEGDPLKGPGEEIDQAVDEALKQFPYLDSTRMAAGGASYGGHLTNWLNGTTTRYKCLFSHAGLINLESQWGTSDTIYHRERNNGGPVWEQGPVWKTQNPIRLAANFKTPILLTVGENDYRVPLNQTLEHWSVLKRRQIPSKLVVFQGENHWILNAENSKYFFEELHSWLATYLK